MSLIQPAEHALEKAHRMQRLDRIRRVSRILSALTIVVSLMLILGSAAFWVMTPTDKIGSIVGGSVGGSNEIYVGQQALGFLLSMVPVLILVYGLTQLRWCFQAFARAQFFTIESAAHLKTFATAVLVSAAIQPIVGALLSLVLTWNRSPGGRSLSIGVNSETLISFVFAGTIAVLAWIMAEATAIADENARFV